MGLARSGWREWSTTGTSERKEGGVGYLRLLSRVFPSSQYDRARFLEDQYAREYKVLPANERHMKK